MYRVSRCGIESLPLTEEQTLRLSRLPMNHSDSIDRMLTRQAVLQGQPL